MTQRVEELKKEIKELEKKLEKETFEPLIKLYKAQIEQKESSIRIFEKW